MGSHPRDVPAKLAVLAASQEGLLSIDQCDAGGLTRSTRRTLIRNGTWRPLLSGVVDTAPVPDTTQSPHRRRRRAVIAALLGYGDQAMAAGPSALILLGVHGFQPHQPPEILLPDGRHGARRPGVRVRRFRGDVPTATVTGFTTVAPAYALAQAVPELDRDTAVAVMDSALHQGVLDEQGLADARTLARRRRGGWRAAGWWALSDGRAESPLETHARLRCRDDGVPPDGLQVEVFDGRGRLLGRGDLGWRQRDGRWLLVEIDGREFHEAPPALLRDRHRQNDLVTHGHADVLRFAAVDVRGSSIPRAVRAHLDRTPRANLPSRSA